MIKYLENEDMNTIIKDGLWIVDFYAEWCGPCRMLGPVLEGLGENVLKINVDNHQDLATKFGVMSIPTMIFFKDGIEKQKIIGFRNENDIKDIINKL